jgi:hypothetical protein
VAEDEMLCTKLTKLELREWSDEILRDAHCDALTGEKKDRAYKRKRQAKKREYRARERWFGKKSEPFGKLGAASKVRRSLEGWPS